MMELKALPATAPGHWVTDAGREMAERYAKRTRESLAMGDRTDFAIANDVFMVPRDDIGLMAYQTAAKERIRWLSAQLVAAHTALAGAMDILGRAESNASGNPEWDYVGPRVAAARAVLTALESSK